MSSGNIPVSVTPPKRGGTHHIYGTFIGGSKLDDDYMSLVTNGTSLFRFSTQRRHEKTLAKIEGNLRAARDSATTIKFNGKLEAPAGNLTEIGKERFVQLLQRRVIEHGQQTFYHVRDIDGKVVNLFENSHRFKLEAIVDEHNRRVAVGNAHELYDQYERDEIELSRMVVDSLPTESFQEKLVVRYGHRDDFETLPGSCLFMMALEACNALVAHDVEGARQKLEAMTLDTYPGENVTDFAADAQKLVKIMQGNYAMPIHTGSNILKKLTKTSSEFFNRKIFALLDTVKTMEHAYKLSDPRTLTHDPGYAKLGPLGIIATLQEAHGTLLTEHDWPALSATLPQSNNATAPTATGSTSASSTGICCFRCRGPHHVRDCTQSGPVSTDTSSGTSSGTTGRVRTPLADWKYVRPTDLTVPYVDNRGRSWKFCTLCRCRATQRVGIYQLSHFNADHQVGFRHAADPGPPPPPAAPAVILSPSLPTVPESNLTQVRNPYPLPPGPPEFTSPLPVDEMDDPDAIEFQGMWCAVVPADDDAAATVFAISVEREISPVFGLLFEREIPPSVLSDTDDDTINQFLDKPETSWLNDNDIPEDAEADVVWFDCALDPATASPGFFWFDCVEEEDTTCTEEISVKGNEPSGSPNVLPAPWMFTPARFKLIHWFYLSLFWVSSLFWDSLMYFISAPPVPLPSRRCRRSKRVSSLRGFPAHWLILGHCVMLLSTYYHGDLPQAPIAPLSQMLSHLQLECNLTYRRVQALDSLVYLNGDSWWQYNQLKRAVFFSQLRATSFHVPEPMLPSTPFLMSSEGMSLYFDTYTDCPIETGDYFFDAESIHDEESPDVFTFHDLCTTRSLVDCCHDDGMDLLVGWQDESVTSKQAYAYLSTSATPSSSSDPFFNFGITRHPVIFDTGASLGITFDKRDFDGPLTVPDGDLRLGGMAQGLKIEGIGPVTWTFRNDDGSEVQIRSNCYYVPGAQAQLISPQRLFNKNRGVGGRFEGSENDFTLRFDAGPTLTVEYDDKNHLPIGYALVGMQAPQVVLPQANVLILNDANQNLTAGQKLLLQWHYRFGHLNLRHVQYLLRSFPFNALKYISASKCDITSMRCAICQYAKGHRRPLHGNKTQLNPDRDGSLTAEHLTPGRRISVDHFESRLLGRTFDSYGKASSAQYKGGCIFVDHGSGYMHVEHQLGFSAVETIRAKQNF
jgi:hypothetical protein